MIAKGLIPGMGTRSFTIMNEPGRGEADVVKEPGAISS
jgi:hypothetical protein